MPHLGQPVLPSDDPPGPEDSKTGDDPPISLVGAELMERVWFAALTAPGSQSFDMVARRANVSVFIT